MQSQGSKRSRKQIVMLVIGVLLILGVLSGGNLRSIGNWSTSELVGYNLTTLIALFGGGYLIYRGLKK